MSKASISTIVSIVFMLIIAGGFYYIWSDSSAKNSSDAASLSTLALTEVSDVTGLKSQAEKLVSGLENNAGVPIDVPLGKMGKANPFTAPQ